MLFLLINSIIFVVILVGISLRSQLQIMLSSDGEELSIFTRRGMDKILKRVQRKSSTKIKQVQISNSNRLYGMMIGIPWRPRIILSQAMVTQFSERELEYVLYHEIGHHRRHHGIKEFLLGVILTFIGIWVLTQVYGMYFGLLCAIILGIIFGIIEIQIGRIHEFQADRYALDRLENPQSMIEATIKFQRAQGAQFIMTNIWRKLFNRSIPYRERIRYAEEEIEKRKLEAK